MVPAAVNEEIIRLQGMLAEAQQVAEGNRQMVSDKVNKRVDIEKNSSINTQSKNYVITNLNDTKLVRALIGTANSINEQVAISKQLHDQLNIGFKTQERKEIGTANKNSKLTRLGISNKINLKILGIPFEYSIYPAVIGQLSDDINIGMKFFQNNPNNLPIEFTENQSSITF